MKPVKIACLVLAAIILIAGIAILTITLIPITCNKCKQEQSTPILIADVQRTYNDTVPTRNNFAALPLSVPPSLAPYDVYLTWYAIKTDSPDLVLSQNMFQTNLAAIVAYMDASVIPYTGIMIHLEGPRKVGAGAIQRYTYDIASVATGIAMVPSKYRIGLNINADDSADWQITSSGVSTSQPLSLYDMSYDNTFYGGKGALTSSIVTSSGQPYQTANTLPCNFSKAAWYIVLLEKILKEKGSTNFISMINWDSEVTSTPPGCAIYQFMFALEQFGWDPSYLEGTGQKWKFVMNGTTTMSNAASDGPYCGNWSQQPFLGKTMGEYAEYQAGPEFYWMEGKSNDIQDVCASTPGSCACRNTLYQQFVNNGSGLLAALPDFTDYPSGTIPTFSIEAVGDTASTQQFSNCINSLNYCSSMNSSASPNWVCQSEYLSENVPTHSECVRKCGTANIFGTWSEPGFKSFLDAFMNKYATRNKYTAVMIYEAGFVPTAWLPSSVTIAGLNCQGQDIFGPIPASCSSASNSLYCNTSCST